MSSPCTDVAPDEYGHVPVGACHSYYLYYPIYSSNAAFAALFGLSTILHLQQAVYYRERHSWIIIVAGAAEFVAFVVRAVGAHRQQQRTLIPGSNLLFLLAPLWINAYVYMAFSRLTRLAIPAGDGRHERTSWTSRWFFWMILLAGGCQAAACGIMFTGDGPTFAAAQDVYMVGMGVQGLFIVELAVVGCKAWGKMTADSGGRLGRMRTMKRVAGCLFSVLALLMMRIIFRLVDFSLGEKTSNPLATSELPVLLLDALPMLLALILLNLCHPGNLLRETRRQLAAFPQQRQQQRQQQQQQQHAHFVNEVPPSYEAGHILQPVAGTDCGCGGGGGRHRQSDDAKPPELAMETAEQSNSGVGNPEWEKESTAEAAST